MSKNKEMLNVFVRAFNNENETVDLIIPNSYCKNIYEVDYSTLKKRGIKNLIFDIDNTIMAVNDIKVTPELKSFFQKLKKEFKICLVSNNNEDRVNPVKIELDVLAIANANKPNRMAYEKIVKILKRVKEDTAIIGDQMLSDIVFGNRFGLYTILVEPYKRKYDIKTGVSRILQNILMRKLKKKIKRYNYY